MHCLRAAITIAGWRECDQVWRGPVTQRHLDLTGIHNNGAPRTANENNKKRKTK
jgi:hypothetical protein